MVIKITQGHSYFHYSAVASQGIWIQPLQVLDKCYTRGIIIIPEGVTKAGVYIFRR